MYSLSQNTIPYLRLKIVWLSDRLGLSVNQVNSENTIFLTSYYFWPINDAWDQIEIELKSKPWVKERERIVILNNVTQIINYWKKNVEKETINSIQNKFNEFEFVGRP